MIQRVRQAFRQSFRQTGHRCFCEATLPRGVKPGHMYKPYALEKAWTIAPKTKVLRFRLPAATDDHSDCINLPDLPAPSGVKVLADDGNGLVSKSYSPISMPDEKGVSRKGLHSHQVCQYSHVCLLFLLYIFP
jgi:hypothetical protein